MTTHAFPALGFDPAPGEPAALDRLQARCSAFGLELQDDARLVRSLGTGCVWQGAAASAFGDRLEDLPRDLERAGEAHLHAARAVARFSAALQSHQVDAAALERQAQDQLHWGQATDENRAEAARVQLRSAAHRLREEVLADARACARALEDAARDAPRPPGWFSQVVGVVGTAWHELDTAVGDFVREHAGVIAAVAGAAAKASSALAVVAMLLGPVPVLGQAVGALAGGAALMAAGVALVGHTALALYADGGWAPVLLDAAALVTGAAPRGVEAVAGRVAAARGLELGETGMSLRTAAATLRAPGRLAERMSSATMTFPALVTRTVSYQFDLAAGGLGVYDLGTSGRLAAEVREAGQRGREAQERRDEQRDREAPDAPPDREAQQDRVPAGAHR